MSDTTDMNAAVPAMIRYANILYDAMLAESEPHPTEGDPETRLYNGRVTELFGNLGISMSYYTPIRRFLTKTGSIEMMKRGGRGLASDVLLRHPPPVPEIDADGIVKSSPEHLTATRHLATLLAEAEGRLDRLEAWRETTGGLNIAEALRNQESRITKLEKQVKQDNASNASKEKD